MKQKTKQNIFWMIIGLIFPFLAFAKVLNTEENSSTIAILRIEIHYSNPSHQSMDSFCDQNFQDMWCDTYFKICITSFDSFRDCNLLNLQTEVFDDKSYVKFINEKAITIKFVENVPKMIHMRVEAFDSDRFTAHDPIAVFESINLTMPSTNLSRPVNAKLKKTDIGMHNWNVNISATLNLSCTKGNFGEYCSTSCFPERSPRTNGCYPNGTYICVPGFRGDKCEKPDACFYRPCILDAYCFNVDFSRGFQCICDGIDNPRCYSSFNPCVPSPCEHDGQCIRTGRNHQQHMCKCPTRWIGETCEIPISPCELAKQKLSTAYLGDLFDRTIVERDTANGSTTGMASPAEFSVCKNGGICVDRLEEFKFSCNCTHGWKGELCNIADWQNVIIIGAASGGLALLILLLSLLCCLRICACNRTKEENDIHPQSLVYQHFNQKHLGSDITPYDTIFYKKGMSVEESFQAVQNPNEYEYCNSLYTKLPEMANLRYDNSNKADIDDDDDDDTDDVGPPPPERPPTFSPIPGHESEISHYMSVCSDRPLITPRNSSLSTGDETGNTLPKRASRETSKFSQWFHSPI